MPWALIAIALLAFGTSALLTQRLAQGLGPLDHPNERSLHQRPIPRSGGLGVLAGLAVCFLCAWLIGQADPGLAWIGAALCLVAAVSFADDLRPQSPLIRLLGQALGAGLVMAGGLIWDRLELPGLVWTFPTWFAWVLSLLLIVWMINLYNFMDGMDGLAGGMAIFGFLSLAWFGWQGGERAYSLVCLGIAAAAGGFLVHNLPPARIFLGDVGSSSLGLLAAASALWGAQLGLFPLWIAGLVFSPFILDATWTLLVRLARGERIWQAHRSHHYQRLVLAGWGQRKTLLHAYGLMAAVSACALAAPRLTVGEQWLLIWAWALIYWLIQRRVAHLERAAPG
ncbi:glycosyltransferase family 4 protein [Caldichromatium japonicum]|uniref:Glycosyltransferase family 4 protein n=1 Tax=Caldichromatium japonicum TaxID=2699430 RepID=A0A6G7VA85_9GAMM|nr:glycosyltransferase family 4 protein [Caldichromatium japonicum]QIK36820.1 glycosyltransferase family 4 protein [Caldichromatium japonicum]